MPQLPPRHVSRQRLLAALDDTANSPLTLLSAGPGAGKTVLLTDWVRRGEGRVAWLNPTAADAEPRRFWHLLISAVSGCDGARRTLPVALPGNAAIDLIQALSSTVPEPAAPLVVIVDDAHMRELRAADLAMTPAEISEVLALHGVSLEERDTGILAARTEGWATGVRLSAMRMEGAEYPADRRDPPLPAATARAPRPGPLAKARGRLVRRPR